MVLSQLVAGLLAAVPAHGFCGAYVSSPDATVTNTASEVVLTRRGQTTVLTLVNDFQADVEDFALVIPVPEPLTADQVGTVPMAVIDRLRTWSEPREVAYTCDDLVETSRYHRSMGCSSDAKIALLRDGPGYGDGVEVLSEFEVSEYDIQVLDATGADGLQAWLDANGYALSTQATPILQEYIDGGSYFVTAKVALDRLQSDWMSPLQFTYESQVWSLPIRIGTTSSAGQQDLVIYALTKDLFEVAITNYPELQVEDECMLPRDAAMLDHYEAELDELFSDGPGWAIEYSWDVMSQWGAKCDPCTFVSEIPRQDLVSLGMGSRFEQFEPWTFPPTAHLTRIRMSYQPGDITQDLMFARTPEESNRKQIRYVRHNPDLVAAIPTCGKGLSPDAERCRGHVEGEGCASVSLPTSGLALWGGVGVLLLWRRRATAVVALALAATPAHASREAAWQITVDSPTHTNKLNAYRDRSSGLWLRRPHARPDWQLGAEIARLWADPAHDKPDWGLALGHRQWVGGLVAPGLGGLPMTAAEVRLEGLYTRWLQAGSDAAVAHVPRLGFGPAVTRFTHALLQGGQWSMGASASAGWTLQGTRTVPWSAGVLLTATLNNTELNGMVVNPGTTNRLHYRFMTGGVAAAITAGVRL